MNFKKWIFPEVDKNYVWEIADDLGLDPLVTYIAVSRGLSDPYDIERFFSKEFDFSDPYGYSGITEAVERINIALESDEKILVFGDYDCDGVTATALLTSYLKNRGANVDFRVPDRETEGYGISLGAVEQAAEDGVTLIITVDNGINAVKEVERANELGVDFVVTDHHLPQDELPDAVAVIDPHVDTDCDWVFHELCGVGVAFKLVCALEGRPSEEMIYEYGDLVALGTIADVVPLVDENRYFVKIGLERINRKLNPGVRALVEVSGAKYITSQNAAFTLCPRINAAGRMASADVAVKMFMAKGYEDASYYAGLLDGYNSKRQSMEQSIFEEACETIESNSYQNDRVIVVNGNNWHVGIIGIVASKITEKYAKPTIVINNGGECSVGSGRSVASFSLFNAISSCEDMLVKFGGHELAAGLTINEDKIDEFRRRINTFAETVELPVPTVKIDCNIKNISAFKLDAVKALKSFEPYGATNPTPLFAIKDCIVLSVAPVSSGKHIRLKLKKENSEFWTVMFGVSPEEFPFKLGSSVDIAVNLDVSVYNKTESISYIVKHIRKSGIDDGEFVNQLNLINQFSVGSISNVNAVAVLPTRDDFAVIFRFLKSTPNASYDLIVNSLCDCVSMGKIFVTLSALCELGLAEKNCNYYNLLPFDGKADLESAASVKKLKSIIGGE